MPGHDGPVYRPFGYRRLLTSPATTYGDRWQENAARHAALYEAVYGLLGTTATILPFADAYHGTPSATTFTTQRSTATGLNATFTWSSAPSTWTTALNLGSPGSYQGVIPILRFDGAANEADSPDNAYWSRAAGAFSVGAWVNMVDATNSAILSKYTEAGDLREWRFILNADDSLQLILSDETDATTPNATLDTVADVALSQNTWVFVVATYDGSADASGINLYQDGAVVASTDTDDANFASLRDTTSVVELGDTENANFFDGTMAGGPIGPFFTQIALTADQVARLYNVGRRALAL